MFSDCLLALKYPNAVGWAQLQKSDVQVFTLWKVRPVIPSLHLPFSLTVLFLSALSPLNSI